MKRTLEGTKAKRQKVSGFRARMSTPGGQEVINRRRAKGRHKLAIEAKNRAWFFEINFYKEGAKLHPLFKLQLFKVIIKK